jgi:hypothetical protein
LVISFEGEFSYDEDEDAVHPRDFRDNFEINEAVIVVPKHDGRMIRERGINWPDNLYENHISGSRLGALVRKTIAQVWEACEETEERRVVGKVSWEDIERTLSVFRPFSDVSDESEFTIL